MLRPVSTLEGLDWVVVALYFVTVFGVAAWATVSERREQTSSTDYFLAGRNVGWFVIGASLFASNIGSEHLVGLAGTGAASGVAVGQFEILASFILLVLGWVFVPFYLRSGVFTMPEFLERRYSPAARWYLAVISIVGYVLTKISVTISAGGIVFTSLMGIDFWTGALVVVVATGIYTVLGGLRAVLYTDLLQMFVLIGGSLVAHADRARELGGWAAMVDRRRPAFMSMWKPMSDPDFPWTGILLGAPILGVWYWCTDQYIVQRVPSAAHEDSPTRGAAPSSAGCLKLLPLFIFVVPGIVAHCRSQSRRRELEPSTARTRRSRSSSPRSCPLGIRGLVVAGLLAALMTSLSSVFNSCSTLVTRDIYHEAPTRTRPTARQVRRRPVRPPPCSSSLGLALDPADAVRVSGQLYHYLQSPSRPTSRRRSPPCSCIGVLWRPRRTPRGAIAALLATGFVLGTLRLVAELTKDEHTGFTLAYAEINFLHFAALLFLVCSVVLVGVSLLTRAPDAAKLDGLTFATTPASEVTPPSRWRTQDRWASVLLVVLVALVWFYFSPWVHP